MKKYTIIGGVNGAGKSSLTGVLKGECSDLGIIVDTDMITAKLGGEKIAGGKRSCQDHFRLSGKGSELYAGNNAVRTKNPQNYNFSPRKRLLYPLILCRRRFGR